MVSSLLYLYSIILLVRILMSWVAPRANPYDQPYKFLYALTEPVMAPFRRLIPPIGMLDISPMILFLILGMLIRALKAMGL